MEDFRERVVGESPCLANAEPISEPRIDGAGSERFAGNPADTGKAFLMTP